MSAELAKAASAGYHLTEAEVMRLGQWAEQAEAVVGAARELKEAHDDIIGAVTPRHPRWIQDPLGRNRDEYDARFSAWHGASRQVIAALAVFDGLARSGTPE